MNARIMAAGLAGIALVAVIAVGGWYVWHEHPPPFCELSGRPIHGNMLTRIKVDGEHLFACCARCGLTLAERTNRQIEILEVTDYVSGRPLLADEAYFVEGSQVEVCSTPRLKLDETRTVYFRFFDRCSPSLLAFAREDEAREFIRNHGGRLKRLGELVREARAVQAEGEEDEDD